MTPLYLDKYRLYNYEPKLKSYGTSSLVTVEKKGILVKFPLFCLQVAKEFNGNK